MRTPVQARAASAFSGCGLVERRHVDDEAILDAVLQEPFAGVVGAGFDARIRFFESVPEDRVGVDIGSECRFAVVGTSACFEHHGVPLQPEDGERHECARHRFPSGRLFKWEFSQGEKKGEIGVKGRVTLGDQALAVRAALDGIGLAFVFEELAEAVGTSKRFYSMSISIGVVRRQVSSFRSR